jgi:uncharacterized protein (TIGR02147 family)
MTSGPTTSPLWKTESYREFLSRSLHSVEGRKANLAAFSRKAGFASRGFMVDLLQGRKRLTARSLPKVTLALGLKGPLKNYFETLVALEEEDLRKKGESDQALKARLVKLRLRLEQGGIKASSKALENSQDLFLSHHVFPIYAALGSLEKGASLEDILLRTGLPQRVVTSQLEILQKNDCVSMQDGVYRASELFLMSEKLGINAAFRAAFKHSTLEMGDRFEKERNSKEVLFYHGAFSTSRARLPELKEKLIALLNDFVEVEQVENGDKVQKLTLGFY